MKKSVSHPSMCRLKPAADLQHAQRTNGQGCVVREKSRRGRGMRDKFASCADCTFIIISNGTRANASIRGMMGCEARLC